MSNNDLYITPEDIASKDLFIESVSTAKSSLDNAFEMISQSPVSIETADLIKDYLHTALVQLGIAQRPFRAMRKIIFALKPMDDDSVSDGVETPSL